jgi:hypothetical protein
MTSYISETNLTGLIREFSSLQCPDVETITLEYREQDEIGCNWRVAAVSSRSAAYLAALAAVDHVAACNRDKWVMVPDDSDLAGQAVQREAAVIDLEEYRGRSKPR